MDRHCIECKHESKSMYEFPCTECIYNGGEDDMSEPKITTNADRIRSMTDEELAEFIFSQIRAKCNNHDCVGADYCYYHADMNGACGCDCEQAIEKYLKAEST